MNSVPSVIVVGGGAAGLAAASQLKSEGFSVTILESSHRVGGRICTARHPFAQGLYGELGAMRIPKDHATVRRFINLFGLSGDLVDFEQKNRYIYLKHIGQIWTYEEFESALRKCDPQITGIFPNLHENERGRTLDELWAEAIASVIADIKQSQSEGMSYQDIQQELLDNYGSYSLREFFEMRGWSRDCIRMYDTCLAHVVLKNSFLESFRDAFLSSEGGGHAAGMQRLRGGMDRLASAFLHDGPHGKGLAENIIFGARVTAASYNKYKASPITVEYVNFGGQRCRMSCDYILFTIPCPAMGRMKFDPFFSHNKDEAFRRTTYVNVTKVLIQFRTRFWDEQPGQGGGLVTDLPLRYIMFPTATPDELIQSGGRAIVMVAYCFESDASSLGALPDAEKLELVVSNLNEIFGEAVVRDNIEACAFKVWSGDSHAGGAAFAYFEPGQERLFHRDLVEPEWDGHAYFAGEHTSDLHGWIEGALKSGVRAAFDINRHVSQNS